MRNQPSVTRPPAANGRTYPRFLKPGLRQLNVSFVEVKHMRKRDIPAYRKIQVAGFQADGALVFPKPPQEITPDCLDSDEALQRGHAIEIDNVGGIKRHEPINVFDAACRDSGIQKCFNLGLW